MTKEIRNIDKLNKVLLMSALDVDRDDIFVERKYEIKNGFLEETWIVKNKQNQVVFSFKKDKADFTDRVTLTVNDESYVAIFALEPWAHDIQNALWKKQSAQQNPGRYKKEIKKLSPENIAMKMFLEKALQR